MYSNVAHGNKLKVAQVSKHIILVTMFMHACVCICVLKEKILRQRGGGGCVGALEDIDFFPENFFVKPLTSVTSHIHLL